MEKDIERGINRLIQKAGFVLKTPSEDIDIIQPLDSSIRIGTPQFSYEEIIKIDPAILEQAESWKEETLLAARRAIPRKVESAKFDDSTLPTDIARLIIWITEVYERTFKDTRRVLDDTTNIEMSNMTGLAIATLRRNSKITNLRQLVEAMKRKLKADMKSAQQTTSDQ